MRRAISYRAVAYYDKPIAVEGLISYRYPNPYGGWIMIGANDDAEALREAKRSLSSGEPTIAKLEVWREGKYQRVAQLTAG